MKKLILFLFMLPLFASGQIVIGDSIIVYGGGSFDGTISLDTTKYSAGGSIYYYATSGDTVFINSDTLLNVGVSGNYIHNQNTIEQTADFWIDGNGKANSYDVGSAYKYNGYNVITAQPSLYNYFFGNAGNLTMTGNNNIDIGSGILFYNTTGYNNTGMGVNTLQHNTTGYNNNAIGLNALRYNTTGSNNTTSGVYALKFNTTGGNNTATGYKSLYDLGKAQTAGTFNTGTSYTIKTVGTTDFTLIGAADNNVGTVFTATDKGTGTGTATPNGTNNNTAIGYNTGWGIIFGTGNTILGANVTGLDAGLTNNIILADGSGNQRINIDGNGNVGIGTDTPSEKLDVDGSVNIADGSAYKYNGYDAIKSTSSYSWFFGEAGNHTMTGNPNTAIGYNALHSNGSGFSNIAIGMNSLYYNVSGINNIAIGQDALNKNTGDANTAVGDLSLKFNTTGNGNVAFGKSVLQYSTTASNNTAIGNESMWNNLTGSYNTAIGYQALHGNTTNNYNTAIGYSAGGNGSGGINNGDNSVYLGANTKAHADIETNQIVIGYNAVGKGSNTAVIGDSVLTTLYVNGLGEGKVDAGKLTLTNKDIAVSNILTTINNSDTSLVTAGAVNRTVAFNKLKKIDATNIDQVKFIFEDTVIKESFATDYPQYALRDEISNTDSQTLSISNQNLTISNGNTVALPESSITETYAEAYLTNLTAAVKDNTPSTVRWSGTGSISGITSTDSTINITTSGIYLINIGGSFAFNPVSSESAGYEISGFIYKNDVKDIQSGFETKVLQAQENAKINFSVCGIISCAQDDILKFKAVSTGAGTFYAYSSNISIIKIK